ncbi:response regulator [Candidatus Riflebacteria bacterium]
MKSEFFPEKPILIVDDDEVLLNSLNLSLLSRGINNVIAISDSREVLPLLSRQEVEMILLDLIMPYISGEVLLEKINNQYPDIPVIILSAVHEADTIIKCMNLGAFDYLCKPLDRSKFINVIEKTLQLLSYKRENFSLRKQLQTVETLKKRLEMEKLFTEVSRAFLNIKGDGIDFEINHALRKIGQFSGMDRSYLYLFSEGLQVLDNIHEWCSPGIKSQIKYLKDLPVENISTWMERLCHYKIIDIPCVSDLPEEESDKKLFQELNDALSILCVPVMKDGTLLGCLGLDSVKSIKSWAETDKLLLTALAEILASAIFRTKAEAELTKIANEMKCFYKISHFF